MKVITGIEETTSTITSLKSLNKKIGLVPTMGALHQGHLSLIEEAKLFNDIIVVSIFVNPTQFDKEEDLKNYPKTIENDLILLKKANCDFVFIPNAKDIYNNQIVSEKFNFDGLENEMEGKHRDGHFNGVGTIVRKLFEITQPTNAYFGEKDFQQLQIIKKLTEQSKLPVEIIGCPIHRESDGLAMSSRNLMLTEEQRLTAPFIYKILQEIKSNFNSTPISEINQWVGQKFEKHPTLKLEYFEIADEATLITSKEKIALTKHRAFIAVFAGSIRLIDNISL
jgi:pantoate--beta-alanine ligase